MRMPAWLQLPWFKKKAPPPPPKPAPIPRQITVPAAELSAAYAVLDAVKQAGSQLSALLLEHEIAKARLVKIIVDGDDNFAAEVERLRARLGVPMDVDYTLNLPDKRTDSALFVRDPVKK